MIQIETIIHEIYTGNNSISLFHILEPYRFYLQNKLCKFKEQFGIDCLFYTIGARENVSAIAIMHPFDGFSAKIGEVIVKGRIKRMLGEIEGRLPYDPIPEYIFINNKWDFKRVWDKEF